MSSRISAIDVDYVLDGGPCDVGVESTIVDLSRGRAVLLRPGGLPREAIEAIVGPLADADAHAPAAPGHARESLRAARARDRGRAGRGPGRRRRTARSDSPGRGARVPEPPGVRRATGRPRRSGGARSPAGCPTISPGMARELYAALRDLDAAGVDVVIAALPPAVGLGEAVGDRLRRAAGPRRDAT